MNNNQFNYTKSTSDVPVSLFLAVSIIIVFSLYLTTAIKTLPCGKDLMSSFLSNFVHVEPYHLMGNLIALYALSRVEKDIGTKSFISLIIFLLLFTSIVEVSVHKLFPSLPCSIGLSGILFGIFSWDLVTYSEIDIFLVFSIIATVTMPSLKNSNVSLIGHAIGAISGVIGGLIWKKITPIIKLNSS